MIASVHQIVEDAGVAHLTLSMMIKGTGVVAEEGDIETKVMMMTVTHLIVVTTDAGVIGIDLLRALEIDMKEEETGIVMDVGLIDLDPYHVLVLLVTEEIEILVALDVIKMIIIEIMVFYLLQIQLCLFLVLLLHFLMEFLLRRHLLLVLLFLK